MRSMWKGAIAFGLVMIPVRLYAATEQKDIAFRQVHRTDGGRIRFRRVCSIDGQEVPYEDVAKGYELPSGEMIVLTDEDLADLPLPTTRSIEVVHFTPAEQLDPILFNRSYYMEPEASGARAYVLLRDSLEQSGKVAIAQVALRQRESLATLRSRDGVLVLETLLWPDEIREAAFPFLDEDIEVRPQELKMAESLIDSMTVDFDPGEYHDGYREALQAVIDAKLAGMDITVPEAVDTMATEPSSLADALRASLAVQQQSGQAGQARGGQTRAGQARGGQTGAGQAKGGPRGGQAKGGPRGGQAKGGKAQPGTAGAGAPKGGTAKPGTAGTGASGARRADGDQGKDEAAAGTRQKRTRRRAS
jgi:DNA end-binding protein Ku